MRENLFAGASHNVNQKMKREEITMNDVLEIRVKTVTPLMQLVEDRKQRQRYESADGWSFEEPFWSANGLRGFLRRVATKDLVEAVNANGERYKIDAENLFLYTNGAGADKKSVKKIDYKIVDKIREKMPIISLFGAGLSQVPGKTAVEELKAFFANPDDQYTIINKNGKKKAISTILEKQTIYRDNTGVKPGFLEELIDIEDIERWEKEHKENVEKSKTNKKQDASGNTKESESHMQQPVAIEYIKAGVEMHSSINPINHFAFTEVELGCLVKTLISAAPYQIGSAKRYGFGRLDWSVSLNGEKLFVLERDKDYTPHYTLTVTEKGKEIAGIYEEWLKKNAKVENIDIKEVIKELTSKQASKRV